MRSWRRQNGSWMFAALIALAVQGAPASAQGLAAGEYKVGFITENTGAIASAGQSYWNGAQLAAEEVKANKYLGGASIVLDPKESGSDAARAIQNTNQFIADRSVLAISCCILSPVAGSLKPIVTEAKTPLVIFGATAAGLPQLPWIYSMTILPGPKDTATAVKVVDAVKPKTAAYILAADNDAFKGRMNATRTALEAKGVATAGVVNVLTKDTDFTAAATQAMGLKPDVILVYATQGAAAGAITALHDRGYAKTIVGNDVLSPAPIFKKMGDSVVGVPFPVSFSDSIVESAEAKAFVAAYQKKFNAPPDIYSAQGYQVVWFIAQGLKSISGAPTRESLATALSKVSKIDHQVYGGEVMKDGQAETTGTLVVAWSADGKIVPWTPPK
ncbi:ABC transporter substrate-binding protein [Variovorax sp. PBL-E5]|uniref:ABC transporter substrate-binding protein n=1 Tax=Variovorax sp. PBL-E5 TaxID=434014 RepID=UPI001317BFD7|nr:ABC transporter substrate-binding protein [Variovorax sp. PBL-E5]VTU45556.1 leucine ABC transporter subunit substrate-binding protein LivK [Variovorax sp. PBL-E5]